MVLCGIVTVALPCVKGSNRSPGLGAPILFRRFRCRVAACGPSSAMPFGMPSPQIRSQIRWIVVFWALMVALQIWDSSDGRGVSGVAEFLSALLGSSGAALLGVAYGLQRTLDDVAGRSRVGRD